MQTLVIYAMLDLLDGVAAFQKILHPTASAARPDVKTMDNKVYGGTSDGRRHAGASATRPQII